MARIALSIRFLLISTILTFVSSSAFAQYGASLEGTVTDKSGAVISGAAVTVTNEATGVSRNTVASDAGFYRVSALTPGHYRVDVEAPSFKKNTTADVHASAESTRGLNVVLTAGGDQQSATVLGGGTTIANQKTKRACCGGR